MSADEDGVSSRLSARDLFRKYAGGVLYCRVRRGDGSEGIGTAFHVGEGVLVTARHVVEGYSVLELGVEQQRFLADGVHDDRWDEIKRVLPPGRIEKGPFFHPDDSIDIGILVVAGFEDPFPSIPLSQHFSNGVNDYGFLLREIVVMGYPPIPMHRRAPALFVARGETNAIVDKTPGNDGHPHFVVSTTARCGFSGGPCVIDWDAALGVVTESLGMDGQPAEVGFMVVLTAQPIFECLRHHGLMPKCQDDPFPPHRA